MGRGVRADPTHPGRRGKSTRPDPRGGGRNDLIHEGADAQAAIDKAAQQRTSRRQMQSTAGFEQISPDVGILDEAAFDDALANDPDAALSMLADLTGAVDERLRHLARRLAGRVVVDIARTGTIRRRGVGTLTEVPFTEGGDLDLDLSIDELADARAMGHAPDPERLRSRAWRRPSTALALVVDRSGSMGGERLATAAVAAAAVAWRAPSDYSVLAFATEVVVVKAQDADRGPDAVVDDLLRLRGHGTTDLALALRAASTQLQRSRAGRKVCVLLSDCRATVPGDVAAAAAAIPELVVMAPADDRSDADELARSVGAKVVGLDGPASVPAAFAAVV